jgi:hypothetical protein
VERGFHGRRGRPAKGRGEGAAKCVGERRGGGGQEGQKGERATTRVSLREKRNDATYDSDLASNSPPLFFPHPCTEDQPLATFFGILQIPFSSRYSSTSMFLNAELLSLRILLILKLNSF